MHNISVQVLLIIGNVWGNFWEVISCLLTVNLQLICRTVGPGWHLTVVFLKSANAQTMYINTHCIILIDDTDVIMFNWSRLVIHDPYS